MMGLCISKRDRNQLMYSGGEEGELDSAKGGDYAARVGNQELSSYNVFFDEWGARFIESGSRRWHVIHMPGTTKFSLQEDRGNTRDLCGRAQLYRKEVYGDIAFSSYLSSPLMNLHSPSSGPTHNLLDAESYASSVTAQYTEKCPQPSNLSLDMDTTMKNSTSLAASLQQRSGDLNSASEADRRDSWIPVLTVESTRHPESSQEMISIKLKKRVAMSPIEADMPSSTTNGAGEIGVFDAEKYFKAPDPQKAEHELILAGSSHTHEIGSLVVENILSASSSVPGSEVQDPASFYQYRNSTAASSDVSYDSRSALTGARKFASSDAMWSSSPCNSRSNSCNKRAKPSKGRGRSSLNKGCRWSFCSRNSAVDAIDEAGFVMSATTTEQHSIKVQDSAKLDSLQFPPSSAYIAAPIVAKLEMPKSRQQSRNSSKLMNELPQLLSPSGRLMNLFSIAEKGNPKSLDCASALVAPNSHSNSLQHQGSWSSRPLLTECAAFMPSPLQVQSTRQHQQSMISGVLQLGQDQMLGGGASRVSQSSTGRCAEESSDGYSGNPEYRSDSFLQRTLATMKGCRDLSDVMLSGLSPQIPTECQASMLGPVFTSLLPQSKANDGTSTVCGDGEKVIQVIQPMPSVPHFEMAIHSVDKDGVLAARRMEKNAESSECNHFEEFLSSSKAKSVNAEKAAAAGRVGRDGNRADIDQENEFEDMEHGSFNMRTMGGKNYIIQKGPECFTFPNLFCLPSSIPVVEENQGIQHLHENRASEEKQSIHELLYKSHSSEEHGIHSPFLRTPSSAGTSSWNNEFRQEDVLERACRSSSSPSGASTPTSSSGGAGSAFGSPFSVAARCSSSDFRSRDELMRRLCIYSQQSRECGAATTIQASISSTFLSNQRPSDPYDALCPSWFDVNEAIASDDHVMQAGDQSLHHVDAEDNRNFVNAERLTCSNQMGDGCALSKEEVHEIDSDSSSDLFDLESLAGCGEGADYGLPVFELRNDPTCILPGPFFTVSDNPTYKGLSSSVVLLGGDQQHTAGIGAISSMQLQEELDTEEEEYNCKRQSVEGMSVLMKRRL